MSVLNINQFYSKEKVRTNKDYELTPQSEWVYGEKEMILFARRYLAYWKEANGVSTSSKQALHKHFVNGCAFNIGDKVWYRKKMRRIIEINKDKVKLFDFYSNRNLKREALIYDLEHCR